MTGRKHRAPTAPKTPWQAGGFKSAQPVPKKTPDGGVVHRLVNGKLYKWEGRGVGMAYWNIGVLEAWKDDKRRDAHEAVTDICGKDKHAGAPDCLVFGTCDNGDHERGQYIEKFISEWQKKNRTKEVPPLQGKDHPMNAIIRCHTL